MTDYMSVARGLAAQCWCDEETQHIEMDSRLAEAFAKRIAPLLEEVVRLNDECNALNEEANTLKDRLIGASIILSPEDSRYFAEMLLNPPEPNEALRKLMSE